MIAQPAPDCSALKGLYLESAAYKARIIDCLVASGFPVHSIKHSGSFHVVQIPTPEHLLSPELFAAWRKQQPADGVPEASGAAAPAEPAKE